MLTLFRIRYWIIAHIPLSLRVGITSGIGLFIAMMGLKNSGIIIPNNDTIVTIGNFASTMCVIRCSRFFIIAILAARNIHAAILISIIITTVIGLLLGMFNIKVSLISPSIAPVVGQVDIVGALDIGLSGVIFCFYVG